MEEQTTPVSSEFLILHGVIGILLLLIMCLAFRVLFLQLRIYLINVGLDFHRRLKRTIFFASSFLLSFFVIVSLLGSPTDSPTDSPVSLRSTISRPSSPTWHVGASRVPVAAHAAEPVAVATSNPEQAAPCPRRSWYGGPPAPPAPPAAPAPTDRCARSRARSRSWYAGCDASPLIDLMPTFRALLSRRSAMSSSSPPAASATADSKTLTPSSPMVVAPKRSALTQQARAAFFAGTSPPPVEKEPAPSTPLLRCISAASLSAPRCTRTQSSLEVSAPLLGRERRAASCHNVFQLLRGRRSSPLRKCSTTAALASASTSASGSGSGSMASSIPGPPGPSLLRPLNRLRVCSRCSSILSMAASSRYSLHASAASFTPMQTQQSPPRTPPAPVPTVLCPLCLGDVPMDQTTCLHACGCVFCKECMRLYVQFEILEGAYDISCPDAKCAREGIIALREVEELVDASLLEKHRRFRLNQEVDRDMKRMWCPRAGCETVCTVCDRTERCRAQPVPVHCPSCDVDFCSACRAPWHPDLTSCEENSRRLAARGLLAEPPLLFDSDLIKCCPMCAVPIEKDEGCAQMMCKRCKHVFCWYCLASLDDDFLLRHYDKGPCKNKLGHSRASVIWHRTQVIGIFAGFGILLLVASPLLLLAAPCIVCCKCRACGGAGKLDAEEDVPAVITGVPASSREDENPSPAAE